MASPAHDKPATGYPLPQSTPAAGYPGGATYCAVPPSSYSTYYQQQPTPTALYNPPQPRPFTSTFLCRFLTGVAAVFTLMALIAFIAWLILKPRSPEIRVVSASVTSLNTTGYDLTAQWDITLVVTNPNHKLTLYYDDVSAGVFYGNYRVLASTRYPPLLQDTGTESTVRVRFAAVDEFVGEGVAKGIAGDRVRGFVRFGVRLSAWVRFKSGIVKSRYHLLEAVCYPLNFDFSPNNGTGTLMRGLNCE